MIDQLSHSVITVDTSSGIALAANTARKYAYFQNDSDTVIYLSVGAPAKLNHGIRLGANGDAYAFIEGQNLTSDFIYAICSATPKLLLVTEGKE